MIIKIFFYLIIIIHLFTFKVLAKNDYESQKILINNGVIKEGINCKNLVNLLGGLNNIELLWLGNLNQEKFQYALINTTKKSKQKIFYLCENSYETKITSKKTMDVLSERELFKIYFNSKNLFTDIFSITSKDSRTYIMSTLNLNSFNINKNEINQAYVAGLMKLNDKKNQKNKVIETEPKLIIENKTKKNEKVLTSEIKQNEIKQNISQDKTPPKIFIAKNLKFKNSLYKIEGRVEDTGSKNIYVEIDGVIQNAKNGKFSFERFSPVDETVTIIAIDQWGNRSKEKIVNIIIDTERVADLDQLEKLNPNKLKFNHLTKDKVAIVIGIEEYGRTAEATYANSDAKYFYEYARLVFGIPQKNIKLLIDNDANLIQSLGVLNKWLPSKINKNRTELIIFFAGHGLASNDGKELYLLPQDSDPDLLDRTALSRNELFKNILKLKPKKVTMFLDTCYSGVSRNEKTLLASARPVRMVTEEQSDISNIFTIFSASKLDQISSGLKEANHGIFSYYLMKGLEGNADFNNDKKITNGELLSYMDKNVSQKAAELGREQNPSLTGDPDKVLVSYR